MTTDAQTKPDDAPYVFKDYLPDGSVEYQVRRDGKILSRHPSVLAANAALKTVS